MSTATVPEGLKRLREHANREHRDAPSASCKACTMREASVPRSRERANGFRLAQEEGTQR